jgi:hypothetical protein
VDGKIVGIAIFDDPGNPRHPTTWHVRDYGLFAANPFGLHEFEKRPAHTGDFTIPAGQSATFRYRFYLHEGDEKEARVAEMYEDYVRRGYWRFVASIDFNCGRAFVSLKLPPPDSNSQTSAACGS